MEVYVIIKTERHEDNIEWNIEYKDEIVGIFGVKEKAEHEKSILENNTKSYEDEKHSYSWSFRIEKHFIQ